MMITKFKIFENLEDIKIGDYVLMKPFKHLSGSSPNQQKTYEDFINNTIGVVDNKGRYPYDDAHIIVKYRDVPFTIAHLNYNIFYYPNIVAFDENIETLKIKIEASKYNI